MDHDAQIKTSIKDFSVLAFSSKRAGKRDVEAMAYVSLAIIYDNQCNYEAAMENYLLYLDICEKTGDTIGAACGYNCLGVNCMLLACPPSDAGNLKGIKLTPQSMEHLTKAIHYHTKHLEIGPDEGGRFVATSNVGLCLGMIGDITQSAKYHQDALRISIKMQTLYGQSIAVGNLGYLALIKEDFVTTKTCFEQHLQLVQALLDSEAEIKAWKMLAKLCQTEGQFSRSVDNLEQAKKIAIRENSFNELKRIHCQIGISKGSIDFSQFSQNLISSIPNDDY
jgi:tetratricopeptide (TPR) repeat protein